MDFFSPENIGAIMIGCMLFAIFVGFPISFTLIFLGLVFGYWGFGKLVFYLMTLQFNMIMTENTLAAVPLFIFMGILMEQAGLMERLFNAVQLMLSKTGPITTNIMLGGIKIPRVPPAQIKPAESLVSYPVLIMVLPAMIPKIVTDAPTIPVAAAKIVETNITA